MKVYVDELPKSCEECPCCNECMDYGISCNLDNIKLSYDYSGKKRHTNCRLQSLADYTKQVRKEVCEEIKDLAGNYFELPYCDNCGETSNDDVVLTGNDLTEILDQIQGDKK